MDRPDLDHNQFIDASIAAHFRANNLPLGLDVDPRYDLVDLWWAIAALSNIHLAINEDYCDIMDDMDAKQSPSNAR